VLALKNSAEACILAALSRLDLLGNCTTSLLELRDTIGHLAALSRLDLMSDHSTCPTPSASWQPSAGRTCWAAVLPACAAITWRITKRE
jgi:hypothetical protein